MNAFIQWEHSPLSAFKPLSSSKFPPKGLHFNLVQTGHISKILKSSQMSLVGSTESPLPLATAFQAGSTSFWFSMELFHVILFTQPFHQSEKGDYRAAALVLQRGCKDHQSYWLSKWLHSTLLGFGVLDINLVCLLFSCLNKKVGALFRNQELLHSELPPLFM